MKTFEVFLDKPGCGFCKIYINAKSAENAIKAFKRKNYSYRKENGIEAREVIARTMNTKQNPLSAVHEQDKKDADAIASLGIVTYPMDLPSLHQAVYGDGKPAWLTTGFDWIDKRHRVADSAMTEIRALRSYILKNLQ